MQGTSSHREAASQKALTAEGIENRKNTVQKKGRGTYWKVTKPTSTLKLSTSHTYVNNANHGFANAQGYNRLVYWPDYQVVGTANDIYQAFHNAGVNRVTVNVLHTVTGGRAGNSGQFDISPALVYSNSFDPLNPEHKQLIHDFVNAYAAESKATAYKFSLDEYNAMAEALKAHKAPKKGGGGKAHAGRGGARDKESKLRFLVNEFDARLQNMLDTNKDAEFLFDVTKFNPEKYTEVKSKAGQPGKGASAIRPAVTLSTGQQVLIPIYARPGGADNFRAYVRTVIGSSSKFSQLVNPIIESFDARLRERRQAPPPAVTAPLQQAPLAAIVQQPISILQPTAGQSPRLTLQTTALPLAGTTTLPMAAGLPTLPLATTATLPMASGLSLRGTAALPSAGGIALPLMSGSFPITLPTLGSRGSSPSSSGSTHSSPHSRQ